MTEATRQAIFEEADPAIFNRAETMVIQKMGPLTRTTTPEQWEAYWEAVAEQIQKLTAA